MDSDSSYGTDFHERLTDIINSIHGASSIRDIILDQTPRLVELFDVDRVTVYSVDSRTNQLFSMYKKGSDVDEIRVPISHSSIAGHCAASKATANIRDAYDAQELRSHHAELRFNSRWDRQTGFRTRQVLVAPILHDGHLLGVIQLINSHRGSAFSDSDIQASESVAKTLAIAFFNQRRLGRGATANKFGYLLDSGILSEATLSEAVSYARINGLSIASVLIDKCRVPKEELLKSLAEHYNTDFFAFDGTRVMPEEFRERFAFERLANLRVAPVERVNGVVRVAVEDPSDLQTVDLVRIMDLGPRVEHVVALPDDIDGFLQLSYGVEATAERQLLDEILGELSFEEEEELDEAAEPEAHEADSVIVRAAAQIIRDAVQQGASDIHVEPGGDRLPTLVRFRVDGACHVHREVPAGHRKALISRIKIMANLDIAERRKPQDGRIRFHGGNRLIELRVATVPTVGVEEDVVMRILSASRPIPLDGMSLSERNLEVLREMIAKPYGIILCVGPTGSGKTTTLHSLLAEINTSDRKIWTAEDPVEITQAGLRQVQVNPKIDFTFASAMRSFLRADPDVIMVGEMRDRETAAIAVEASLTGHLVLSTLHTNSAPETVTRLLEMDIDPFNFADSMIGVLAQRLVRTLCPECRQAYPADERELAELARDYGEEEFADLGVAAGATLQRASGCAACGGTGYRGRVPLHELLFATPEIKRLVRKGANAEELYQQARQEGMTSLLQDGIRKVLAGRTDMSRVRAVCSR